MKCNKIKNPCKICFQSVSKKNGIQCEGACQKWAHFKCLNYTPGKIQDIKAGVIKITCPCPDCNTTVPKEILTDPPYTCTNTQCPVNKLPVCSSMECPSNIKIPPSGFETSPVPSYHRCPPPRPPPCPPPRSPPCPPPRSPPCPPPRSPPCPPIRSPPCPPPRPPPCPPPRPPPCLPPKSPPCPPPRTPPCPPRTPPRPIPPKRAQSPRRTSPRRIQSPKCPSPEPPCPSPPPCFPRNCPSPCPPVCPPNCPSWQKVKKQKKACSPKQSQSCSDISSESSSAKQFDYMRTISSDSKLPTSSVDQKMLFSAIENLCSTVGQLSSQLRDLMCKIQTGLAQ